jgi:hypothetical protein
MASGTTPSCQQPPDHHPTCPHNSAGIPKWLAELYGTLRETPFPGQSTLAVWPHPWLPNTYTVPFLDGRLVYAVLEATRRG